ncbi:MAG TPA: YdhK family protein [Candidatus Avamphibacillus sp.]|nr:YdhK family protein [Candidatus Avamphibacillus sp.]
MNRKLMMGISALFMSVVLVACGGNENTAPDNNADTDNDSTENMDMDPSSSGEIPDDLADAENPTYPVESKAKIKADHMKGMDGAIATIEGAYDTIAYEVTYTPNDGGEKVENHKWVIHEEMKDAEEQAYEQGDEVILEADHMEGMKGATATIDDSEDTTVYMVSYKDTETNEEIQNHKWVVEDELTPVK